MVCERGVIVSNLQLLSVLSLVGAIATFAPAIAQAQLASVSTYTQNAPQEQRSGAEKAIEVTGVRLNSTPQGLELILETAGGQQLPVATPTVDDNSWIADLPQTRLVLPEGDYRAENPAQGISLVTVTQIDANRVRVQLVGETAAPIAEVVPSQNGLVVTVTPATAAPTAQTPTETETITEGEPAQEITVTATRTAEEPQDVPRSVTIINREQIEQQTRLSQNVGEILGKLVPGLAVPTQSSSNFGQTLRGRNIQVLIDGIPQSTSRNAQRDLRTIDPSAIERIEVVRGPSAIYGDGGTGGVINIITRTPSEERLASQTQIGISGALGNLSGDSLGYNLQHAISGTEDNLDFAVSGSLTTTGGFFDAEGDRIPPDPNAQGGFSDAETLNFFSKLGVNLDEQQRLQLTFNHFDDTQDTDFTTDPSVNLLPGRQKARTLEGLNLDELPGTRNTLLNLQYSHENLLGSNVQAQLYYRDYLTEFFPFDGRNFSNLGNQIYQSRVESERFGGRLQIETPLFNKGAARLLWGVDYFNEDTVQPVTTFDRAAFAASGGLDFLPTGERTWTPPLELNSLGLFAQLTWDVSDRFIVNGGVRYENADVSVDDFTTLANPDTVIPGGDLNFDATLFNIGTVLFLTEEINVFANFAQGFSLADIGLVLRNAQPGFDVESLNPEPQQVDSYEIGVRGQWETIQGSLSAFYNESELGTTFTAPGTVLRAPERIYGVEAAVDVQPSDRTSLGGSVTLQGGEIDLADDGEYTALDGFRIPPLKVVAYVENETSPGWRNRLQALFSGDRDVFGDSIAFGRREVESYLTVDYISSIQLGDAGTLQIGVENLFDNQYFPIVSQIQANDSAYSAARGRTVSIKYSIDW
ncbi:TonB-dependent receptor [Chroococcidiopsis sp. CCNUC1]|nr:TonB-dependent receptor [Chroococcidiopsis sp. CCNUC1]